MLANRRILKSAVDGGWHGGGARQQRVASDITAIPEDNGEAGLPPRLGAPNEEYKLNFSSQTSVVTSTKIAKHSAKCCQESIKLAVKFVNFVFKICELYYFCENVYQTVGIN